MHTLMIEVDVPGLRKEPDLAEHTSARIDAVSGLLDRGPESVGYDDLAVLRKIFFGLHQVNGCIQVPDDIEHERQDNGVLDVHIRNIAVDTAPVAVSKQAGGPHLGQIPEFPRQESNFLSV